MGTVDEGLFRKGLEQRKSTLGADCVDRTLVVADDFTRPVRATVTAWCRGGVGAMR